MSSQVVYVSKGTHPMIPLRLYSAHGHKRKETPIFFVAFISPPFPLLPSFLHPFWPLSTSSPLSFLHLPPHPPPRQAHSPLPSPLSLVVLPLTWLRISLTSVSPCFSFSLSPCGFYFISPLAYLCFCSGKQNNLQQR